jgi:hypothetical protein
MLYCEQASDSRDVAGTQYSSQIWEIRYFPHTYILVIVCGKTCLNRPDIVNLPLATGRRTTGCTRDPCCAAGV